MTKKRAKSLFVVFAIILVVCLVFCFVNFTYPWLVNGNYYSYSNFVSNLKLGEDIGDSYRIIYRTKVPDGKDATNYSSLKTSTMNSLKQIIQAEGFKDVTVTEYGEDCIAVQIGNILSIDDENLIISLIGSPEAISFSTDSEGKEVFATGSHIKSVVATDYVQAGQKGYVVSIEFKDKYKEMVESKAPQDTTIYVHLGEEKFEWKYGIPDGVMQLSSSGFESIQDAQTYANKIKTGMLALELTKVESGSASATYGMHTDLILLAVVAVLVIAAFVYLIIKYKHMGWLSCFNLLFFIVISIFLLQSIPLVHLNFAGILGLIICTVLAVDGLMSIFESAKKHYQEDRKLYISFKLALKENLKKLVISNSFIALVGFICIFVPTLPIQAFGWVALVMPLVAMFCQLVLMRLFIKMYLALNSLDGKKCNFQKGGKNAK